MVTRLDDGRRGRARPTWWRLGTLALAVLAMLETGRVAFAWQSSHDGVGRAMNDGWNAVVFHPSGDVIVTGLSYAERNDQFDCTLVVARLAKADGSVVWRRKQRILTDYRPYDCTYAERVLVDASGDVVIGRGGDVTKRSGETGKVIWSKSLGVFPRHGPFPRMTALDPHGNVLFAAGARIAIDVRRMDGETGRPVWSMALGNGRPTSVASDANGDVIVAGVLGENLRLPSVDRTALVLKLDGDDGDERWRFTVDKALVEGWSGSPPEFVVPAGVAPNGDVFLAVTRRGKNAVKGTVYRLAASDGSRVWRRSTKGRWLLGMAVDANGDVLLRTAGPLAKRERITKLDGASGETLWSKGTGIAMRRGRLALTPSGDAIAGGTLARAPYKPVVLLLDGTTGARLWRRVFARGATPRVAAAPSGDVLVSIDSPSFSLPIAQRVLKLDGTSGTSAWDRSIEYDPDTGACESTAFASDAAGNALLGGCRDSAILELQFEVTSLAAADGSRLWGRRLIGSPSIKDILNSTWETPIGVEQIATDTLGNVVVVGVTADDKTGLDFTVVKWSSVDGGDDIALPSD